jgi:hypothetical protein
MDSELRRRFLQRLGFDLAAVDLGVGDPAEGQRMWPIIRAWWLP